MNTEIAIVITRKGTCRFREVIYCNAKLAHCFHCFILCVPLISLENLSNPSDLPKIALSVNAKTFILLLFLILSFIILIKIAFAIQKINNSQRKKKKARKHIKDKASVILHCTRILFKTFQKHFREKSGYVCFPTCSKIFYDIRNFG